MDKDQSSESENRFAKNLKTIRLAHHLTIEELSQKAGLRHKKRIERIEAGYGKPTVEEIIQICKVLEVSIDDMLTREALVEIKFI